VAEELKEAESPAHGALLAGLAVTTGAVFTATVVLEEVLALKLVSPLYWAVIECDPAASDAVEKLACPEASSVSVPIRVAPSVKATVPVGMPRSEDRSSLRL
jgi:hypothetical protein